MALSDPNTITLAAAIPLPKIVTEPMGARYTSADGTVQLYVSHVVKGGTRKTLVRVSRKKVTTNPLNDIKSEIEAAVNFSFVRPAAGFTETELLELLNAPGLWLSAGTNANAKKINGLES